MKKSLKYPGIWLKTSVKMSKSLFTILMDGVAKTFETPIIDFEDTLDYLGTFLTLFIKSIIQGRSLEN